MKKGALRKSFEFLLVFFILLSSIILLEYFKSSQLRLGIITCVTSFYIITGVVYHYEQKNLRITQVLEYFAIGTMMFIILSAIYR